MQGILQAGHIRDQLLEDDAMSYTVSEPSVRIIEEHVMLACDILLDGRIVMSDIAPQDAALVVADLNDDKEIA